jgi:hypothetical protein
MVTEFSKVYNYFYSKVTDDMYMELDKEQTERLLEELMLNAIPWFEFPRVDLYNYDLDNKRFNVGLSNEEMHIIAVYMVVGWLDQQLASVEVTRMKYTGSDFKMTSQANHMSKLLALKKEYEKNGFHLQRLYKRRKNFDGSIKSTLGNIMPTSVRQGELSPHSSSCTAGDGGENWNNLPDLGD